jgi:hypothetical protein
VTWTAGKGRVESFFCDEVAANKRLYIGLVPLYVHCRGDWALLL